MTLPVPKAIILPPYPRKQKNPPSSNKLQQKEKRAKRAKTPTQPAAAATAATAAVNVQVVARKARAPNFTQHEDISICQAYVDCTQNYKDRYFQNMPTFWTFLLGKYNVLWRQQGDLLVVERTASALMYRMKVIQGAVTRFTQYFNDFNEEKPSNTPYHDIILLATDRLNSAENDKSQFRLQHIVEILQCLSKMPVNSTNSKSPCTAVHNSTAPCAAIHNITAPWAAVPHRPLPDNQQPPECMNCQDTVPSVPCVFDLDFSQAVDTPSKCLEPDGTIPQKLSDGQQNDECLLHSITPCAAVPNITAPCAALTPSKCLEPDGTIPQKLSDGQQNDECLLHSITPCAAVPNSTAPCAALQKITAPCGAVPHRPQPDNQPPAECNNGRQANNIDNDIECTTTDDEDDGMSFNSVQSTYEMDENTPTLAVGDRIEYLPTIGTSGVTHWITTAKIVQVRPGHEYPIKLSNLEMLETTHQVKKLPDGRYCTVQRYRLIAGGLQQCFVAGLKKMASKCKAACDDVTNAGEQYLQRQND